MGAIALSASAIALNKQTGEAAAPGHHTRGGTAAKPGDTGVFDFLLVKAPALLALAQVKGLWAS